MDMQRRRVALLLLMAVLVLAADASSIVILYRTALSEETARLREMAQSQARLIEAVARFDKRFSNDYPEGAEAATLSQILDAHSRYDGFGRTGEFTLSRREGDAIRFLMSHRHADLDNPRPVPWASNLAEPMRRALSGQSGTIIGLDYRGETVVAAYEPVAVLDLGIVAKLDLAEVRAPFVRAGLLTGLAALVFLSIGAVVFLRLSAPLVDGLRRTVADLERALREVKTLRGILPFCAYCKKVRNDAGYWSGVDVYIREHTEADLSHGICPECRRLHFPGHEPADRPAAGGEGPGVRP